MRSILAPIWFVQSGEEKVAMQAVGLQLSLPAMLQLVLRIHASSYFTVNSIELFPFFACIALEVTSFTS